MDTVRIVWGTATGPTAMASYDAALAAAGVHDYNLTHVSSVVPPETTVDPVGTAPDLGPPGHRQTVVEARGTARGPAAAAAALGWSTAPGGPGLFYECGDATDIGDAAATQAAQAQNEAVANRLREECERVVSDGLAAGRELRDWDFEGESIRSTRATAGAGEFVTAVVLGVYGEGEPIV